MITKIIKQIYNKILLPTNYSLQPSKGFTLIELIIVLAILTAIAGLAIPFSQTFRVSSDLNTHTNTILQTLQRAQQLAITGQNSSAWGVYFDDGNKKFTLFKGVSYATRDTEYDLESGYADIFVVTTDFGNEIYFALFSGRPSVNGTTTVASVDNDIQYITIKNFGLIQLNE